MSTMTLSTYGSKVSVNQGFQANPSAITLNRRGRLARTCVVLSLAIVLGSVVSAKAGAGTTSAPVAAGSFITVTVAPGETVWSLANHAIVAPFHAVSRALHARAIMGSSRRVLRQTKQSTQSKLTLSAMTRPCACRCRMALKSRARLRPTPDLTRSIIEAS